MIDDVVNLLGNGLVESPNGQRRDHGINVLGAGAIPDELESEEAREGRYEITVAFLSMMNEVLTRYYRTRRRGPRAVFILPDNLVLAGSRFRRRYHCRRR